MNEQRQDSAFYTNQEGVEVVWESDETPYYVVRNGEMRILYKPKLDEDAQVIRYTDQLERIGVLTDKDLGHFNTLGDEVFNWVDNSWFEVRTERDTSWYSDVVDTLDDAIAMAMELGASVPTPSSPEAQ